MRSALRMPSAINAASLHFETHHGFIDVTQDLIGDELCLILSLLFCDEGFGPLALIAI